MEDIKPSNEAPIQPPPEEPSLYTEFTGEMNRRGAGVILTLFVITEVVLVLELLARIFSVGKVRTISHAIVNLLVVFAIHYLMRLLRKYKHFFWFDLVFSLIWCSVVIA